MTVYSASVYVVSDDKNAFFQLGYDNEVCPELVIEKKDTAGLFLDEFSEKKDREKLISDAFDANLNWEDSAPHTLADEVDDAKMFDSNISKEYRKFCKEINEMDHVKYVLLAVDSDKHDWLGYSTYWYDAIVLDFDKRCTYSIGWRGTELEKGKNPYYEKPFYKTTAKYLIEMIETNRADQIVVGDFELNGKLAGKVTKKEIKTASLTNNATTEDSGTPGLGAEEVAQLERIASLIKKVDTIDFKNKVFVFDRLDYVFVNGEFAGPDSPNNPIVKRVIDAGGLMRKNVSGKTDYLVLNNHNFDYGRGAKCRDALQQIDKGKNITIITLDNLLDILG